MTPILPLYIPLKGPRVSIFFCITELSDLEFSDLLFGLLGAGLMGLQCHIFARNVCRRQGGLLTNLFQDFPVDFCERVWRNFSCVESSIYARMSLASHGIQVGTSSHFGHLNLV